MFKSFKWMKSDSSCHWIHWVLKTEFFSSSPSSFYTLSQQQQQQQQQSQHGGSNSAILPSLQMGFEFNSALDLPNFCNTTGKTKNLTSSLHFIVTPKNLPSTTQVNIINKIHKIPQTASQRLRPSHPQSIRPISIHLNI